MENNTAAGNTDFKQGKKSCFWHLTAENAIEVPVIQRDYAQGRDNDDVRQIREPFMKKIFGALGDGAEPLELDFIYGSLEKPRDISLKDVCYDNFVPLDGQQRLTTLFLLHWFLSLWNKDDFNGMKSHFTGRFYYKTRQSSTDFCREIIAMDDVNEILDNVRNGAEHPVSQVLIDEGWFHDVWMNDPTVSGMLRMLDTISEIFMASRNGADAAELARGYFGRLTQYDIDSLPITFNLLYLNRGDFHLSDELYIKMNSRGKPLSDFETFKARFETFLRKNTSVPGDFAGNIDGKWADVFWNMRNNVKPKSKDNDSYYRNDTDGMMMNLIKTTIANRFALLADDNDGGLDELFETQAAKNARPDMRLTFYRYTELGVFNDFSDDELEEGVLDDELEEDGQAIKDNSKAICQSIYDTFSFIYELKKVNPGKYEVSKDYVDMDSVINEILFYEIDGKDSKVSSASYGTRLIFWAYCEYCLKFKKNILANAQGLYLPLDRWMRFVRNMVEAAEFNKVEDMQKAIKVIGGILDGLSNGDVVDYLANLNSYPVCVPFPQEQIKEEVLKAWLITRDITWEDIIKDADNTDAWPGRSGYLLYYAGLSDIDKEEDLTQQKHLLYQNLFKEYKGKMDMILEYLNDYAYKEECLLERAMLSKGNYMRHEKEDSELYSMMDSSVSSRSYSWRQLVQYNGIDCAGDASVYKEGVDCLKLVLDDGKFSCSDVTDLCNSLKKIIEDGMSNIWDWRLPMLESPELWNESIDRCIWFKDDIAWVTRKKGGRTNQYETWSYTLYLALKNGYGYSYYHSSYPRYTYFYFMVGEQKCIFRTQHTLSGKWVFEIVPVDENYHKTNMTLDIRKEIISIMPNSALKFCKDSRKSAIIWAEAMYKFISRYYTICG